MTTTENTERSKGTIAKAENSGTVGVGEAEVDVDGLGVGVILWN
jgi:hypothetical protein